MKANPDCEFCGGKGSGVVPGMGPLPCSCTMQRGGVTDAREHGVLEGLRLALTACEGQESRGSGVALSDTDRDEGVYACENAILKLIKEREGKAV